MFAEEIDETLDTDVIVEEALEEGYVYLCPDVESEERARQWLLALGWVEKKVPKCEGFVLLKAPEGKK